MQSCQLMKTTMTKSLLQKLTPPPNNILETEGVDRMGNENEERKIEGVDYEIEWVDSDNKGVDKEVLPPDRKGYRLRNPPNVNYSHKGSTWQFMGWNNLIVGSNELHSISKAYVKVFNTIAYLIKPTPPTRIITNNTILKQYIIKGKTQGLWKEMWG